MKNIIADETPEGVVVNIREEMGNMPQYIQPLLTLITGRATEHEQPLIVRTKFYHLIKAYLFLFGGMGISGYAYSNNFIMGYPIGFLLTVSGARNLSTVIGHYLVHKDFFSKKALKQFPKIHALLGEINASFLFLQHFSKYVEEHLAHHTVRILATVVDPDMVFLFQLGFKPGMKKQHLWINYWFNTLFPFSPLHILFLWARVKATFTEITFLRGCIQIVVLISLFYLGYHTSFWTVFWIFIFPLTYGYHIAALSQFVSEHYWVKDVNSYGLLDDRRPVSDLYERSIKLTLGRFCGERIPSLEMKPGIIKNMLWVKWWVKMLFFHLPTRLFVLPGDLCDHDLHHRSKRGDDWANSSYQRNLFIRNLKPNDPPLLEVWGLFNAIDIVFEHLSKLSAIEPKDDCVELEVLIAM